MAGLLNSYRQIIPVVTIKTLSKDVVQDNIRPVDYRHVQNKGVLEKVATERSKKML